MGPPRPLSSDRFDAVLFDLDGVLTATAKVHAASWKRMFDDFLRRRAEQTGEEFRPFEIDTDYKAYVDGKPRYDGVRSFLAARRIELPEGDLEDPPGFESVTSLGNLKDKLVNEWLDSEGVETYPDAVALVHRLRELGIKTAVVSSSRNCRTVLRAARIEELFEIRIDGEVAARLKLKGKPAPDTFLEAAMELGVEPRRAVVVEDAISGVQAGRAGGFGLVIGVDRTGHGRELEQHGADEVTSDLSVFIA
jgi:beta-phosphoglucomutase family hydrolase